MMDEDTTQTRFFFLFHSRRVGTAVASSVVGRSSDGWLKQGQWHDYLKPAACPLANNIIKAMIWRAGLFSGSPVVYGDDDADD